MALLKAKIARLQKELQVSSREGLLAHRNLLTHVRQIQNDPKWRQRVRAQYTEEVSQRTLELNEALPLDVE
jgi:hypothetical protein